MKGRAANAGAAGAPVKLTAGKKLELIRIAVYSVGETITAAQALALIGALFSEDPIRRIDPARLPELLARLEPARRRN